MKWKLGYEGCDPRELELKVKSLTVRISELEAEQFQLQEQHDFIVDLWQDNKERAERAEADLLKLKEAVKKCPWPEDIWTMTNKDYINAIPDERLRTAISGFLMRKGWEILAKSVLGKLDRE